MFVLTHPATRVASPQFARFIDRLFDENSVAREPVRTPALDVAETDAGYTLLLDIPGVAREQLKVSIEGRRVTIETVDVKAATSNVDAAKDVAQATDAAAPRVLYRERSVARFARTVTLPAEVDQVSSSAKFEDGVLTLSLAKKVPTGASQLSIG